MTLAWQADLAAALETARAQAYAELPEAARAEVEALTDTRLLHALDLDPDDDELCDAWSRWLAVAPASTRYAVAQGGQGTGSVLDVDHLEPVGAHLLAPEGAGVLLAPLPGLVGLRRATDAELLRWFGTERPTIMTDDDAQAVWDGLTRGDAVAVTLWADDEPRQLVLLGVTGD